jgi:hypothetical protein
MSKSFSDSKLSTLFIAIIPHNVGFCKAMDIYLQLVYAMNPVFPLGPISIMFNAVYVLKTDANRVLTF